MPWQQAVADVVLEVDPKTGLLFYREWNLLVPRQSGKTTLILAKAVHRALAWGFPQNIAYAAQTRNDARKKWEDDHVAALDASPIGKRRPKPYRVRKTNGNEAIIWANGSKHGIVATTEKSGHGSTLDEGYVDEAFAQADNRLEQAFKPAMITRPDPQLGVVSTAGRTPGSSPYLWAKVETGRARCAEGSHPGVAYFEWSAADDMDRADPATWWATMPALGHTITEDAIAADFATMEPAEFDRAYLNRWNPHARDTVIPLDRWAELARSKGMGNPPTLAVDVTPDGSSAAIAAAGQALDSKGRTEPKVVAGEIVDHRAGTGWLVPRVVEVAKRQGVKVILLDATGPAGGLLTDLESAVRGTGITIRCVSIREHAQACGGLLNAVLDATFVHPGSPVLDAAVGGASRRVVTDAWLWSRRSSSIDISPLVAVGLARWGHLQGSGPPPEPDFIVI